jgi:uncharacterized protein
MTMSLAQVALGLVSGGLVGFSLGLVGGGGSILATPLLVYVVGVASPHVAIGTGAVAVAINALASLASHASAGHVKWRCAGVFAAFGVAGAVAGSTLGKAMDGERLLALFALLMIAIGALTLRRRGAAGDPAVRLSRENGPMLAVFGFGAGALSGFFGIGGGFLIVPGMIAATGMPTIYAVGSSLVAVAAFGAATAGNYAVSGFVDWPLALTFVVGGGAGAWLGMKASGRLAARKGALDAAFAVVIMSVGAYMLLRSARTLL